MTHKIPAVWPTQHLPALQRLLEEADYSRRRDMVGTANRFCAFCERAGIAVQLSSKIYTDFEVDLRSRCGSDNLRRRMRHLYDVGIRGADQRATEDIPSEPWWPNIPRLLVTNLDIQERRRHLQELDNFFRWRQRTATLPSGVRHRSLFLARNMTSANQSARLSVLCCALEVVLPGDADLLTLRQHQRRLHRSRHGPSESRRPKARRIPDVEALLAAHRNPRTGKPSASATESSHRAGLNLLHDLLARAGRPLIFDKHALDLYADYTFAKREEWQATRENTADMTPTQITSRGWCLLSAASKCMAIAPYIPDPQLKRDWYSFAHDFEMDSEVRGDPKMKELALAERPMDLSALFLRSLALLEQADAELDIQVRHGILATIGALGILLFYPARKADLLNFVWGQHLTRKGSGWLLAPDPTQKTGSVVHPQRLPDEATCFLDTCLLGGASRDQLTEIYRRRQGEAVLKSPHRNAAYHSQAFSPLFKRWVGHPPHTIRSIWCDELVARGTDRETIAIVLQHKENLSQKAYEVIAGKIRAIAAVRAITEIANSLSRA